ncbi:transcription factor BIM2-like [Chenopodium quinoa]|uniref:transcription factor BIM2-like n=1 Tax=Chenopodium quinoa TaxID=63459 RepID=UPI000B77B433|nr:transcription factor BIM2-like [Chenopodium quinoa]
MVRTVRPHHQPQEDEEDDAEDVAAGTDTSSHREGKSAEQKPSNYRSKHSETEQRRRSKINERFQILKDLIPPNEQKRDKASLLLEVIEYIRYLQEKLQVYEGPYQQQAWPHEATKLIPWRANHGPVDNYANHSQVMKNGFLDENSSVQPMTAIQGSVEPEFGGEFSFRADHHHAGSVNPVVPMSIPLQPCTYPPGRGILPIENVASHPHGSSAADGSILLSEDGTFERGSSSVSDIYSQGLLKRLTQELQTSGVDLSQANISVQLDVGKGGNSSSNAIAPTIEDVDNQSPINQPISHAVEVSAKESIQAAKRIRTGER